MSPHPEWRQMILDGRLIGVEQAAQRSGVKPGTIRQWVVRGWLEPVNPGGTRMLFLPREVDAAERGTRRRDARRGFLAG